jgi:hypothetical protein
MFEFILLETIDNMQLSAISNLSFIHGINKCMMRESKREKEREREEQMEIKLRSPNFGDLLCSLLSDTQVPVNYIS